MASDSEWLVWDGGDYVAKGAPKATTPDERYHYRIEGLDASGWVCMYDGDLLPKYVALNLACYDSEYRRRAVRVVDVRTGNVERHFDPPQLHASPTPIVNGHIGAGAPIGAPSASPAGQSAQQAPQPIGRGWYLIPGPQTP